VGLFLLSKKEDLVIGLLTAFLSGLFMFNLFRNYMIEQTLERSTSAVNNPNDDLNILEDNRKNSNLELNY